MSKHLIKGNIDLNKAVLRRLVDPDSPFRYDYKTILTTAAIEIIAADSFIADTNFISVEINTEKLTKFIDQYEKNKIKTVFIS